MEIVLLRRGSRALVLPRASDLIDCPPLVRHWLGTPYTVSASEITADSPLLGLRPPEVLAELLQKGFCALDMHDIVRCFVADRPR